MSAERKVTAHLVPRDGGLARREHLKQYILACVRDSALSWADLASPEKFLGVLSKDVRIILKDLGREGLRAGVSMLAELAATALTVKK